MKQLANELGYWYLIILGETYCLGIKVNPYIDTLDNQYMWVHE